MMVVKAEIDVTVFVITATDPGGEVVEIARQEACGDNCDEGDAELIDVPGSAGRLVLAQHFEVSGEDIFVRDIEAWVIDRRGGKVLWTGVSNFRNEFGVCETWTDIVEPRVEGGELLIVLASGTHKEPEAEDCTGGPITRRVGQRIRF